MAPLLDKTPWQPLVAYRRAEVTEVTIHGALVVVRGGEGGHRLHAVGGDPVVFARSLTKPFMARALASRLDDATWEQRAMACASHNGTPRHVAVAESLLPEAERRWLRTPASEPLGGGGDGPSPWRNPCSGEHAAILRASLAAGWPVEEYRGALHPSMRALAAELGRALGEPGNPWEPIRWAEDGCGLPTPALPLSDLARLYAELAGTRARDWIWEAMCREPFLVGGDGRLDTAILTAGGGRVLAKEGADGLLALAVDDARFAGGLGIALKIAHGWDTAAAWHVARELLGALGIELREHPAPRLQEVNVAAEIVPPAWR